MTVASDALVLSALAFGMLGCTDLPDPKKGESDGAGGGSDALTWSGGIRDIFQQNCVRCHASGQFSTYEPMQTYQQVLEQVPNIAAKIQDPPWRRCLRIQVAVSMAPASQHTPTATTCECRPSK